ncbi:YSIRK-type signal peptide-containing protein [Staphylococcus chromogenes]
MRENFKLRKMKVGLVSVAIAAMYITIQGQAEASENVAEVNQPTAKQTVLEKQVETKPQLNTETQVNPTVHSLEQVDPKQKETKADTQENFVRLNQVQPGDTKITGKTVPNQIVSLTLDGKSVGSVEGENDGFTTASESGDFEFDLKDRKIVYNQKVDVSSSNLNFELEDEGLEDEMMEEEIAEATDTTTTGRYDKAYEIPTQQLEKKNGHHQVLVEPIIQDSGIIKGHTSVKGRVALAINNHYVNLSDSNEYEKGMSNEAAKSRLESIWKHIDDKGYFEFDLKRKPFENYHLKKEDLVSLTFKPDDEEEALNPLIFNVKVSDFDTVASATTTYRPDDVKKVVTLNTGADDLEVENIHGFVYESDRGIDKPVEGGQGTRIIKGKTNFANAVVNVTSSLGEGNEFPDLQVNDRGEFSFNASEAGYRLNNGEKLHFTVVNPLNGNILSKLVTKEVQVAESEEQKKERVFDELLEVTPAYYQLVGDEIRGYDTLGNVLTYFNAYDKKELAHNIYKGH